MTPAARPTPLFQGSIGVEYLGASVDAYVAQRAGCDGRRCAQSPRRSPVTAGTGLLASSNSLAGTISDNTAYAFRPCTTSATPKIYAGYEHIQFANPTTPLAAGFDDIGGYKLAFVNKSRHSRTTRSCRSIWVGVKYTVLSKLDLTAAYYGYKQNSYGIGAECRLRHQQSGTCSGTESAVVLLCRLSLHQALRHVRRRHVHRRADGLANGYDLQTTDIDPTDRFPLQVLKDPMPGNEPHGPPAMSRHRRPTPGCHGDPSCLRKAGKPRTSV